VASGSTNGYRFARIHVPINPELVGDFTPKEMATFTAGWTESGRRKLAKTQIKEYMLIGMADYFNHRMPDIYTPRFLREEPLRIDDVELSLVPIDERTLLARVVQTWPLYDLGSREFHLRMDTLWTPDSGALETPIKLKAPTPVS